MSEILISFSSIIGIADLFIGLFIIYSIINRIFKPTFFKGKFFSSILAIILLSLLVSGIENLIKGIENKPFLFFMTCLSIFILLIIVGFKFIKHRQYSVKQFDIMNGHTFERACADILKSNGFKNVEVTKGSGDFGVDILAEKNGIRYAVQCKRYSNKLDNTPIQEVIGGLAYYHCQKGIVMTNSYFTEPANTLAKVNNVELWDRDKLVKLAFNTNRKNKRNKTEFYKSQNSNHITPAISNERKKELYEFACNINRDYIKKELVEYLTDFLNETSEKIYFYYTEIKEYQIESIDSNFDLENKEVYYYYKLGQGTSFSKIKRTKTELIEYLNSKYIKTEINKERVGTIKIIVPFPERISNLLLNLYN